MSGSAFVRYYAIASPFFPFYPPFVLSFTVYTASPWFSRYWASLGTLWRQDSARGTARPVPSESSLPSAGFAEVIFSGYPLQRSWTRWLRWSFIALGFHSPFLITVSRDSWHSCSLFLLLLFYVRVVYHWTLSPSHHQPTRGSSVL